MTGFFLARDLFATRGEPLPEFAPRVPCGGGEGGRRLRNFDCPADAASVFEEGCQEGRKAGLITKDLI